MVRTIDAIRGLLGDPARVSRVGRAGRILSTWSGRFFKDPVDSFFPGFVILALAAIALVASLRARDDGAALIRRRVVMLAQSAPPASCCRSAWRRRVYGWLFDVFPPMQGLRAAARFGNLFLLAVAVLGGMGAARILRPIAGGGTPRPSASRCSCSSTSSRSGRRSPIRPSLASRHVTRCSRANPGPSLSSSSRSSRGSAIFQNGPYVLASTAHWRPLMNGYSGYTPETYQTVRRRVLVFSGRVGDRRDETRRRYSRHGASGRVPARQDVVPILDARRDFELIAIGADDIRLYRLKR